MSTRERERTTVARVPTTPSEWIYRPVGGHRTSLESEVSGLKKVDWQESCRSADYEYRSRQDSCALSAIRCRCRLGRGDIPLQTCHRADIQQCTVHALFADGR